MFNSTILDVIIGLAFLFLTVSLIASAITEAISSIMKLRAQTLLSGIKALLNDPNGTALVKDLYNHALINPHGDGNGASADATANKPAYIDPQHFADAFIQIYGLAGKAPDVVKTQINSSVKDPQLQQLLNGMVDRVQGDVTKMRTELATWFDNAMDGVSGAYKRMTQWVSFLVALSVAVLLNANAFKVTEVLWKQPILTKAIEVKANGSATAALQDLDTIGMPVGWGKAPNAGQTTANLSISGVFGWLITAVASLMGAPFWYDTLQTFVRIKGAGPSPAEKKSGAGAAA